MTKLRDTVTEGMTPMPKTSLRPVRKGEPLGQIVGGRWRLHRIIGRGGTATVYEAHSGAGEVAAVKVLSPRFAQHSQARERFRREAIAAQSIRHSDVVHIYEEGDDPAGPYIAMELLDGRPLSYWLKRGGLPVNELVKVLVRVLDVLAVAHGLGIIHRDIKPANIFLTRTGGVKVLDFGVARMLEALPDDLRTKTGIAIGTVTYMAPEQARGIPGQVDARSDLFSLAATAFRVLAGRPIHQRRRAGELLIAMATEPAPQIASVTNNVPRDLQLVIDLALTFSMDGRYPDARTMQADLRAIRAGQHPPYATVHGSPNHRSGTVPAYPFQSAQASGIPSTIDWGTPNGTPAPVSEMPKTKPMTANSSVHDQPTVPFAAVPEAGALDDDPSTAQMRPPPTLRMGTPTPPPDSSK